MQRDKRLAFLMGNVWHGVGEPTGGIVINDVELAHVLVRWAELIDRMPCSLDDCLTCNADHAIWWDWMNSLSGPVRIRAQRIMRECGVPFPRGPWEEVPTNAVSTALN